MSTCPIDPEVIKKLSEETIKKALETVLHENGILEPSVADMVDFIHNPIPTPDERALSNTRTNPNERFVGSIKEGFIEGTANMEDDDDDDDDDIWTLPSLQIFSKDDNNMFTLRDNMYISGSTTVNGSDASSILFTYGNKDYKKTMCELYSEKTINDICNIEMADYNKYLTVLKNNLNTYTTIDNYQTYLGGIINERLDFLDKIKNKINTYKQNNFIDNRKNSYLSSNLEFYNNLHFYIFILYYAIFIAFLIFSNFIKDKLYENKYVMIYVVVILIIPFILRYFLLYIYNLYISYIERNYLKLDEISYKYLVEETDHQKTNKVDQDDLNNFYVAQGWI